MKVMTMGRPSLVGEFKYVVLVWMLVLAISATAVSCCSARSLLAEKAATTSEPLGPASYSMQAPTSTIRGADSRKHTVLSDHPVLWVFLIGPSLFLVCSLTLLILGIIHLCQTQKIANLSPWNTVTRGHMSAQLQKALVTGVPTISLEELEAACEDFSNIIGSSFDSMVFKGTLTNRQEIAVIRYSIPHTSWNLNTELYFRRRVEALARMNHRNLVNLTAYCSEDEPFERMLVFEYAENGTVFEHLHNKESEHLDWPTRMRIVMGAAYALQYMHHELVPPCSHTNFDSNSVYLSEDYVARVADFGISKLSVRSNIIGRRNSFSTAVNNEQCIDRHTPDIEGNVFSFGLFLLETITAKRNAPGPVVEYAEHLKDPERMCSMVDSSLQTYKSDELVAICQVVRLCIQPKASKRPSMREVTLMLSNALQLSPEAASRKMSPLLWAELQLLSPVDSAGEEPETPLTKFSSKAA